MNMTGHIFRKDVRHFLPEILLVSALTITFAWAAPVQWGSTQDARNLIAGLLRLLIPIAWLVLLSRLIHEESLVGDRQFWITRPYRWGPLLAAKSLFVFCFLFVPLLLAEVYLLHHAGLSVTHALPDLLRSIGVLFCSIVLPFVAVAVVTTSFAKQALALLAGIIYLIATSVFAGWLLGNRVTPPYLVGFLAIISAATLIAVITLQYARRWTRLSRILLFSLPVALLLLTLAAPQKALIRSVYPASMNDIGRQITFNPDPASQQPVRESPILVNGHNYSVRIPISLPELPNGLRLKGTALAVTITDADGYHWSSSFQNTGFDFAHGRKHSHLDLEMPSSVFDRVSRTPVHLDLDIPVTRYTTEATQARQVGGDGTFRSPSGGICSVQVVGTQAICLYALRNPIVIDVGSSVQDQPCETGPSEAHNIFKNFLGSDSNALTFDFDPVVTNRINFGKQDSSGQFHPLFLCPGAALQFTPHSIAGNERLHTSMDAVLLAPYALNKKSTSPKEDDRPQ